MPTTALNPGSTNTVAVKQLQDFLVQMGYMTAPDVATGYGTYGPKTTEAVKQFQSQHNVNTSGGGAGNWGPLTIKVAQSSYPALVGVTIPSSQPKTADAPSKVASGGGTTGKSTDTPSTPKSDTAPTTPAGIAYDSAWSKYGVSQDVWNSLNATQQGVIAVAMDAAKSLYSTTSSPISLSDALTAAAKDPNIIAKYGDALKLDTQAFAQNLQQIQTATTLDSQKNQLQFEKERKALAEQSAAAGQAYSGFRGKAQSDLAQSESAIVTSSRADLQKKLQESTSAFEAKYGTAATTPASATFLNPFDSSSISASGLLTANTPANESLIGSTAGGITGTEPISKQQEINKTAGDYVTLGQMPEVKQPS